MISFGCRTWALGAALAAVTSTAGVGKWFLSGVGEDRLVFGNYEGYISEDLLEDIRGNHEVSVDYFDHDYSVRDRFGRGIYDLAVVSTSVLLDMKRKNLLAKVEWDRFGIKGKTNKEEAKELFSDTVKGIVGSNEDFLSYGVPYFLNKLSFCYVGEEIEALKRKVSWRELLEKIVEEPRFRSVKNRPQLAMIDDPRTVLSLARLVSGADDVNLQEEEGALEIYNGMRKIGLNPQKMGKNFLLMNPSSSLMIDSLASQSIKGGFMYNGDCLFASKGGNGGTVPDKFHIVETDKDIYFLDFIVFSAKTKESRKKEMYEFVKKLIFEGMESEDILKKGGDGKYIHPPMRNFDFVQYTPTLKKMLEKVEEKYFENDGENKEIRKKILSVGEGSSKEISNLIERPFTSDRKKSDVFGDYERFKLTL